MTVTTGLLRRHTAAVVALVLAVAVFLVGRPAAPSAAEAERAAERYSFAPMAIALPGGHPQQTIRRVNQDYKHIDAWISSVGAGVTMDDIDGDGLSNDLCVTDPRIDRVVVTPAPGQTGRYAPFALDAAPLPMSDVIAPMGCGAGDFDEDGRTDLFVYYWGRTPVIFLGQGGAGPLAKDSYTPVEAVPGAATSSGRYRGPQWNSNAIAVADFDGDGHDDVYVGNYFPDGPVLDDTKSGGVVMNESLSRAFNGGEDHLLRWSGKDADGRPQYEVLGDVLPEDVSKGWVLASSANDLDGDQRPELYIAQDHGPDALLHNRSEPGEVRFVPVAKGRPGTLPKSKRVGADSFKGMGIDYGDLNGDGMYDMFVSNITTPFGIQESNFQFMSTAADRDELRAAFTRGDAPFDDRSSTAGTAWSGWGWDVKMADFDNSGELEIAQATGFVKGEVNRWPQLQELAAANDDVVAHPGSWPHVTVGDDIAGSQRLAFFARSGDGGQYANVADQLGLGVPVPTRGIAVGDADGDGRLDLAVARQWDAPVFYRNQSPAGGSFLGLRLTHEGAAEAPGSPVVGAQATVTTSDGRTLLGRVDGGGGHSGKRSHEVHVGLGEVTGPVRVALSWRDRTGQPRRQQLELSPGWHNLELGVQAREK